MSVARHTRQQHGPQRSGRRVVKSEYLSVKEVAQGVSSFVVPQRGRGRAAKRVMEREREMRYAKWLGGLLSQEREEEERRAVERMEHWSTSKLARSGLALLGVSARKRRSQFYGRPVIRLSVSGDLPFHEFRLGDLVVLSNDFHRTKKTEGAILEKTTRYVDVALSSPAPRDLSRKWRLDKYYGASSYERMEAAVGALANGDNDKISMELRRIIVRSFFFHNGDESDSSDWHHLAKTPTAGLCKVAPSESRVKGALEEVCRSRVHLDATQKRAAVEALRSRVALIQGPPGTGKTRVAAAVVVAALVLRDNELAKRVRGELPRVAAESAKKRVLCCAGSNVAADNLLERLLDANVTAIRLGQPAAVHSDLRNVTLDAKILEEELVSSNKKSLGRAEATARILRKADVVVASCVGSGGDLLAPFLSARGSLKNIKKSTTESEDLLFSDAALFTYMRFGLVVVDEAAQATEPTCLVPLAAAFGASQLILVGDQMQLPPTVLSRDAMKGGLGTSLFERLADAGIEPSLLSRQYRMHPSICAFASRRFYKNQVRTCPIVADERQRAKPPQGFRFKRHPVAFVDVSRGTETYASEEDRSYANLQEVTVVADLVKNFSKSDASIGVISPYRAQAKALSEAISFDVDVEINTVDAFQGREKDIVIVSTVRANDAGHLGFLGDFRRLNVAVTRAKRALIVVGHRETLLHDPHWRAFIDYCHHLDCLHLHDADD